MINNIFRDLIAEGIMVVYLDDILIFTRMEEEHAKAFLGFVNFYQRFSQDFFTKAQFLFDLTCSKQV